MMRGPNSLLVALPLCFALFCCATPAKAATAELQGRAMPREFWGNSHKSVETRRQFAVGLLEYWKAVSDRIPRLPPKELAWIKQELSTSDSGRLVAAMNRKEGALYLAADAVDFCVQSAQAIIPTLGKNGRAEALAWVHSMRCYASTDSLPQHLYKAGLISEPRTDSEIKMQMFSIWWQASLRAIESALSE